MLLQIPSSDVFLHWRFFFIVASSSLLYREHWTYSTCVSMTQSSEWTVAINGRKSSVLQNIRLKLCIFGKNAFVVIVWKKNLWPRHSWPGQLVSHNLYLYDKKEKARNLGHSWTQSLWQTSGFVNNKKILSQRKDAKEILCSVQKCSGSKKVQ